MPKARKNSVDSIDGTESALPGTRAARTTHSLVVQRSKGGTDVRESDELGEYDENYNLVSVLYHALQGAETYGKYIKDAERAGDNELVDFFEEVREEEIDRAARAKKLLIERLLDEEELEEADDDLAEEE